MEQIKIFVTRVPEDYEDCPFVKYKYDDYGMKDIQCSLNNGSKYCSIVNHGQCDMLERGLKINDMRY